ncbi:hypothetical protein ACQ4M3_39165 [Leptolyngbya sp. AN03gr2]|uniref:hypothetical protein n=1 Tax=Leptolyngbya sp. AN03gr2 TaxID=3423364 RepID=UPI003D31A25E
MVPFLIYSSGVSSVFVADILVTRFFSDVDIALWAEVKSLIGIVGVLAAAGLDLVFVRTPSSSARLLLLAVVQVPIAALVIGFLIHSLGYLSSYPVSVALTAGSAFTFVLARYFGANQRLSVSQFIQQGWKIVALCVVVLAGIGVRMPGFDFLVSIALLIFVLIGVFLVARIPPAALHEQRPESVAALYSIALRFMITNVILGIAVYGEQLIVSALSNPNEAAIFFTHAAYFLFPVSVLNGYLAFRIGPWLRDNHDQFRVSVIGRPALVLLIAFGYTALTHIAGSIGWLIVGPSVGEPDPLLQAAFFVSALSRTVYTLPSGYNGVFGQPKQHDLLIALQTGLLMVIGLAICVLNGVVPVVHLVAFAGAANWVLRTAVSYRVTKAIIASIRE